MRKFLVIVRPETSRSVPPVVPSVGLVMVRDARLFETPEAADAFIYAARRPRAPKNAYVLTQGDYPMVMATGLIGAVWVRHSATGRSAQVFEHVPRVAFAHSWRIVPSALLKARYPICGAMAVSAF